MNGKNVARGGSNAALGAGQTADSNQRPMCGARPRDLAPPARPGRLLESEPERADAFRIHERPGRARMASGQKLYEGKAKIVYATDDPDVYVQDFKDSATAFDGKKKGTIGEKGRINNAISARLFGLLEEGGVKTHFLGLESDTAMRIRRLDMFQVEFVVRNMAAGSLSKRIGYPEGTALKNPPIVEYYYKDDELGDPLLCMAHLDELEVVDPAGSGRGHGGRQADQRPAGRLLPPRAA